MKKTVSKFERGSYKCLHCERVFDFPASYCVVCGQHTHTLLMGGPASIYVGGGRTIHKPAEVCAHCFYGRNKYGRAWRKANGTWYPDRNISSSWDNPEWYDGVEEWKNTTVQYLWNENADNIQEL